MSKKVIERNHKVEKVEKYSFNGLMDMLSRLNGKLNYSNYFGDSRVGNRIINEITLKKVPGKVVNERISYIFNIFKLNGYDENDAYFYLTTNKNILKLSVDSLLNKLSILYEAGMLEEVFFNHPYLLTEVISDKDLYEQYTKKSIKDMNYSEFKLILDSLKNNFTNHLYENSEQVLSRK